MRDGKHIEEELFDLVKSEPTELSLERVDKMVAAFPLVPLPFDWSSIINLNTIIMSSITAFILAGSFMLYSGNTESEGVTKTSYQIIPDTTTGIDQKNTVASSTEIEGTGNTNPENAETTDAAPFDAPHTETLSVMMPTLLPIIEEAEEPAPEAPEVAEEPEATEEPDAVEEPSHEQRIEARREAEAEDDTRTAPPNLEENIPGRREFSVGDFHSVGVSGGWDIEIRQGNNFEVWAEGEDSKLDKLIVEEKNGELKIKSKKDSYWAKGSCDSKSDDITVHVTMPTFKSLSVAGGGTIDIGDFDNLDNIDLHIAGSGDIMAKGNLNISNSSSYHIAGSGTMNIDGNSPNVEVHIAGSGDFRGADLNAKRVEVHIAGSGDVAIHADEELDVSIAGSGDVRYSGNPKVKQSIAGSGDINRMN